MSGSTEQLADLKRRNKALQARLALYESAFEHMHQGLCVFDPDGRIALCNRRYAEVIRLPADKLRPGSPAREPLAPGHEAAHPFDVSPEQLEQRMWTHLAADDGTRSTLERDGRTYAVCPSRTASGSRLSRRSEGSRLRWTDGTAPSRCWCSESSLGRSPKSFARR